MNNLFVPSEIALALKEIGFDEPCFGWYADKKPGDFIQEPVKRQNYFAFQRASAPVYDQVVDWFRAKGIEVFVMRYTYRGGKYMGKCFMWAVDEYDEEYDHEWEENPKHWVLNERRSQGYEFKDAKEALNAGILKAIELIKQKK